MHADELQPDGHEDVQPRGPGHHLDLPPCHSMQAAPATPSAAAAAAALSHADEVALAAPTAAAASPTCCRAHVSCLGRFTVAWLPCCCLGTAAWLPLTALEPTPCAAPTLACSRPGCPTIDGVSGVALSPVDVVLTAPVNNGGSPVVAYRVDGVPATAGRANITVTGLGKPLSLTQARARAAEAGGGGSGVGRRRQGCRTPD